MHGFSFNYLVDRESHIEKTLDLWREKKHKHCQVQPERVSRQFNMRKSHLFPLYYSHGYHALFFHC